MPEPVSVFWGVIASILISAAKRCGMPSAAAPIANYILALGGSFIWSLSQGATPQQALAQALSALFSSHLFFRSVSRPLGESMAPPPWSKIPPATVENTPKPESDGAP